MGKGNRFIYITASVFVILVCLFILLIVWTFPLLASPDGGNVNAAITALDRTPMTKVEKVQVFTGGQVERSVEGLDSLGRKLYVFVVGNQVYSLFKHQLFPKSSVKKAVLHSKWKISRIISIIPGEFAEPGQNSANLVPVWQVTAEMADEQFLFAYFDIHNGRLMYENTTAPTVSASPQVDGLF